MIRQTRTAVVAALVLAALTGCGGSSQADSSNVYEPLPPLSTATPSASPAPQPTSRPAPESSESSTTAPAGEDATDPQSEAVVGGAPAGSSAAGGGTGQASGSGTSGTGVPVSGAVPAPGPAPAPVPVPGTGGGGAPAQVTERTSSSTTTVTSTTLEARVQLVVSCEGLCVLDDLTAPELTGGDGPISSTSLQRALEEQLGGQDGDQQRLTDELAEQLTKGDWELADTLRQGGDEKLVFTSARK